MKIGIIGNMNNMYFSLARYLADEGYDCELLIFDSEPDHFHPSSDLLTINERITIRQLTWGDPAGIFKHDAQVIKDLAPYQFLIGNGTAPAFVNRIGRRLNLFIPYGDDLYSLPFLKLVKPVRMLHYAATTYYQRRGINNSPYILFDKTNPAFETVFKKLDYKGNRIVSPPPLFYNKEYDENHEALLVENPFAQQLQLLRNENELLVLQHTRQLWKPYKDKWHLKGNDILINGFADFVKNHSSVKAKLLLIEYGIHVAHTKKLIADLGIEKRVVWFPKMQRKYLMAFVKMSDVVVGELHHSWLTYCVVMEVLSMGKPLMHKRIDSNFTNDYSELYPMYNASTRQHVANNLEHIVEHKEQAKEKGEKGREWYLKYGVTRSLAIIIKIICEQQKQNKEKLAGSSKL